MPRRRVIWAGDVFHRPSFGSTEGFEFSRPRCAKSCPFWHDIMLRTPFWAWPAH